MSFVSFVDSQELIYWFIGRFTLSRLASEMLEDTVTWWQSRLDSVNVMEDED